jgi:hypothetical protein
VFVLGWEGTSVPSQPLFLGKKIMNKERLRNLRIQYGKDNVWTRREFHNSFSLIRPIGQRMCLKLLVTRLSDGSVGTIHLEPTNPRIYYNFQIRKFSHV